MTTTTKPVSKSSATKRRFPLGQFVVYLLLLLGGVAVLVPFLWMLSTSFKTPDQLFTGEVDFIPKPWAPQNYLEVWGMLNAVQSNLTVWRVLGNTLFITVLAMIGEIFSASLVAYGFARFRWRGRNLLFAIMLGTVMIPGIVTRVPAFLIWRELGLLNTFDPLTWPSLFAWGPLYVFLMRQFFLTISRDIEDAATIDGANALQTYWYILLPIIRPIMLAIAVLSFQANWNNFQGPLLYLNSPEKFPLALAIRFFDQSLSKEAPLWNYMMALATMMALPVLALYFFAQKQFLDGINIGGAKE
jgi:multiple sugar transport system permease protein